MDMHSVGRRIKEARKAKNLTQEDLADMVNTSTPHIGVIERGVKTPKLNTFVSIANALDKSADWLLQDVVDASSHVTTGELSELLDHQPPDLKRRVFRAIRAFLED